MKRSLLAAGAAAVLALGLFSPVAFATETEPDCSVEQQILKSFQDGPPGTLSLVDLQSAVDAAILADNEAGALVDSDVTVDAKAALDARLALIAGAQADLDTCLEDQTGDDGQNNDDGADDQSGDDSTDGADDAKTDDQATDDKKSEDGTEDADGGSNGTVQTDDDNDASDNPPLVFNFESDPVNTGVASSVPVGSVDTGA